MIDKARRDLDDLVTRAHRALVEANAGTPPKESSLLVAGVAHHLALYDHPVKVSVTVPPTEEAAKAVIEFLSERRLADPPWRAANDPHTLQPAEGESDSLEACVEACTGHSGEGLGAGEESPPDETRQCTLCSASFTPNRRHLKSHVYCSSSCRSKARHRQNRAHALSEGLSEAPR